MPQMSPSSLHRAVAAPLSPEAQRWVQHYTSRSPARVAQAMRAHQATRPHQAGFDFPSLPFVPDIAKINNAAVSATEVVAGAWASSAVGVIVGGAAGLAKAGTLTAALTGASIGALVGPFLFLGVWLVKRAVTPSPAQLEGTKPTGKAAVEEGDKLGQAHELGVS